MGKLFNVATIVSVIVGLVIYFMFIADTGTEAPAERMRNR